VIIQVEPETYMPMYILIPPKTDGVDKPACFIAPPGHQGAGKYSVAGCSEIPAVKEMIEFYNYDYGLQLAKLGYVAICPDCRGFGERRDESLQIDGDEKAFLTSTCYQLGHMAEPLGQTVIGMNTWDLMRLIDYIYERNEWRLDTLGCLGFSGGGMQTLWLSALDDRIKQVVISGYMYGYRDSLLILNENCSCNYVPHLWEHLDMGDIGALIAPRPLMIQSCREDHLNGPRGLINVFEQMDILKKAYELYGKTHLVVHDIRDGRHCWHGNALKDTLEEFKRDICSYYVLGHC
jgi:dienelactone hydrolase